MQPASDQVVASTLAVPLLRPFQIMFRPSRHRCCHRCRSCHRTNHPSRHPMNHLNFHRKIRRSCRPMSRRSRHRNHRLIRRRWNRLRRRVLHRPGMLKTCQSFPTASPKPALPRRLTASPRLNYQPALPETRVSHIRKGRLSEQQMLKRSYGAFQNSLTTYIKHETRIFDYSSQTLCLSISEL